MFIAVTITKLSKLRRSEIIPGTLRSYGAMEILYNSGSYKHFIPPGFTWPLNLLKKQGVACVY